MQGAVRGVEYLADETDKRNKEWAVQIPTLNVSVTMQGDVADRFDPGKTYVLQLTEDAGKPTAPSK